MTGYLYILKHGIGPGTMPNDVTILKEKDLPNYYTAVWLDRFLTTSELKQYDIPSETRINELLSRIDYCQTNNGDDVVPCDEVNVCDNITASKIIASKMSDIDLLMKEALDCTTKDELSAVISGLDSLGLRKLYLHYMEMLRDDSLSVGYIASDLSDTLYNMFNSKVNAYGDIKASTSNEPDNNLFNRLCDSYAGIDPWAMDLDEIWIEINDQYHDEDLANDVVDYVGYRRGYDGYLGDDIEDDEDESDIESSSNIQDSTDPIESSKDTKYFANMVSADTYFRHPEEWGYEVQGYYDIDRRGLAESDWTEDIRMVNDLLNEYANKGYYLRVTNRYAGVILDIDADDWFDSFYPDGLSEGELE